MHPVLFEIAGFKIATYGLLYAGGALAGIYYLSRRRAAMGLDADTLVNLCMAVFIAAILGGKALYIATMWGDYSGGFGDKLRAAFTDFRYGFVFFGGLIASVAASWFYLRRRGLPFFRTGDFFAPALALAHAIGRLGCFCAGCCHGRPTHSFIGITFTDPRCSVEPALLGLPLYPTQLMESAGNLILFAILHKVLGLSIKNRWRHGTVLLCYTAGYSLLRFTVEFFRGDDRGVWMGFSQAQWIAVLAVALSAAAWKYMPSGKEGAK